MSEGFCEVEQEWVEVEDNDVHKDSEPRHRLNGELVTPKDPPVPLVEPPEERSTP